MERSSQTLLAITRQANNLYRGISIKKHECIRNVK